MTHNKKYYLIALIPPFMGAASYVMSKYVIGEVSPIALLFLRWLVAVAILTPFSIRSLIAEISTVRENLRILTIIAVSGVTLFNLFSYHALQYTTSTNAAIIIGTFPIFVLALGFFINKEKLKQSEFWAIIFSFAGVLIIISRGHILEELNGLFANTGDFLSLVASLCWAIYVFSVKYKPTTLSFKAFVYSTFLIGTLLILPIYLFDILYLDNVFKMNLTNVSIIFFLGFGVSIVGMSAFSVSILKLGPVLSSTIYYLAPVFTSIMAVMFLGEKLQAFHVVGMMAVVFGINLPFIVHLTRGGFLRKQESRDA